MSRSSQRPSILHVGYFGVNLCLLSECIHQAEQGLELSGSHEAGDLGTLGPGSRARESSVQPARKIQILKPEGGSEGCCVHRVHLLLHYWESGWALGCELRREEPEPQPSWVQSTQALAYPLPCLTWLTQPLPAHSSLAFVHRLSYRFPAEGFTGNQFKVASGLLCPLKSHRLGL